MDSTVRKVTELQVRREADGDDRPALVRHFQLTSRHAETLDDRSVKDWEDREHEPSATYRPLLCARFDVRSLAILGLGNSCEATFHWTWMTPKELNEEVNRRRVVQIMGTAGAAGAVEMLLPVPQLVALAQVMDGRRVGAADLAAARQTATVIAAAYTAAPDAVAIRAAQTHAYTLVRLLQRGRASDDIDTQMRAVASDAAALAGYADMRAGRLDAADAWFAKALELARQAADRRLEALALVASAFSILYRPDPARAEALAALEAAGERHQFLPPAARAFVFYSLGDRNAAMGEDLVSGRFLEHAWTAAGLVPYASPGWGWWSAHGELGGYDGSSRLQITAGSRHVWLGHHARALALFDAEIDATTHPVRLGVLHKMVMEACAGLGDPERACASGIAALEGARTHGLGALIGELHKARAAFPPHWGPLPQVRDFDERLALATTP